MALYYVTGLSGTGKSAVLRELRARGYHARGVDEDGYADWINRITGHPDAFPRDDPEFDFHAWYAAHYWVLSVRRVSILSRAAARLGKPVFLCGSASGDDIVWQLFDKVIALVADERTIRQRWRPPGRVRQDTGRLADVLFWHRGFETAYRGFGATIIDATGPCPKWWPRSSPRLQPGAAVIPRRSSPGEHLRGVVGQEAAYLLGDHGRVLQGRVVADAVHEAEPRAAEERVDPVRPLPGEQRVMLGPQHDGRCGEPVLGCGRGLGSGGRGRPGAGPVPLHRGRERAGRTVDGDQVVEVLRRRG